MFCTRPLEVGVEPALDLLRFIGIQVNAGELQDAAFDEGVVQWFHRFTLHFIILRTFAAIRGSRII